MTTQQQKSRQGFWQSLFGRDDGGHEPRQEVPEPVVEAPLREVRPAVEIAPNDPIVAYFASASGVVEIDKLDLDSPALRAMKAADIKVVVPLVSQGELIGLLNLGPRLSQQEYSADDRKLLNDLATQTAPAVQVAQLVRQQQQQAQERAHRAGAQGRPPHPKDPPAQACARDRRLGCSCLLPPSARGRRRLL
jgi:hypothetical protein